MILRVSAIRRYCEKSEWPGVPVRAIVCAGRNEHAFWCMSNAVHARGILWEQWQCAIARIELGIG
jgi:hypothetical protein